MFFKLRNVQYQLNDDLIVELDMEQVKELNLSAVRDITFQDFVDSLKKIRRSVSPGSLAAYEKWKQEYADVSL